MASLLDWFEEATANVNPFDNGATAETVVANRKKKVNQPPQSFNTQARNAVNQGLKVTAPIGLGALNTANLVGSGFNQAEASKRNRDFLQTAGLNKPLAKELSNSIVTPEKAGQFLFNNTAKLVNTADTGVIKPIGLAIAGYDENQIKKDTYPKLFSDKGGLLNAGTFFPNQKAYNKTVSNPLEFGKGFTAAGVATAGEVAPTIRGASLAAKPGLSLGKKIALGATEGAAYGGSGAGASQYLQEGKVDPLNVALGAGAGAILGGGIPAVAPIVKGGAKVANQARPSVVANQSPKVLQLDDHISNLQKAFDTNPNVNARKQISQAMTDATALRRATYNSEVRRLSQGGYIAGPQALGFGKAKEQGLVFDGVDGKPRFEVDDSGAKLNTDALNPSNKLLNLQSNYGMLQQMKKMGVNNPEIDARLQVLPEEIRQAQNLARKGNKMKVSDILEHDKMFDQYPDLKDVNVKVVANRGMDTVAAYDSRTNTVELNKYRLDTDPEKIKGTVLHELQHAIQDKEGFASGGYDKNMDTYKKLAGEAEARAVQARMNMPMSERYNAKTPQLEQVNKLNPMTDSYHTGIRSEGDVKTFQEAFDDPESFAYPDFSKDQGAKALQQGKITVYSSKPLGKNEAQFVTPSRMQAKDYAGDGQVHSKVVDLDEVAWINGDEGNLVGKTIPKSTFYDSLDVPKKDLIIRNGGGKAMSIDPKGKKPTDKVLGSKPAEFFFGDKKPVQQAIGRASSETKNIENVLPVLQKSKQELPPQQLVQPDRTNIETMNRSSQPLGQQNPVPDSMAPTDRTYVDNTTNVDTKQYVKEMSNLQKQAQKGDNGLTSKTKDFKEKFIDDLAPIEDRLRKAIKSGASVDPKDHISYQLDRSRRSEGITHSYIRDNGLDKIIQNVPDTKEFDQYLIAKHAKELDEGIKTGRNAQKDAALVTQLDGKYSVAAKELYNYNQKLLDTSVEYGLISKEAAAQLKKKYPEYVPFNRIFNEDELANLYGGAGKGSASISKQTAVQKIKGSERAIASPLNSIIDKTRVVVEQGERNRAAQILADYRNLPGNPFNLKEIPSTETIGSRSTISYLDNGVKRTFETDKEIADAAKNMTREEIGLWGRIAAVPARVLRGGATTVNVGFAGANVVKDIVGAAINSRHPFRIANPEAFGKALAAALNHNGKSYQELMREGVAGTSFDMYRNPLKSNVGEIRSQKNPATRLAYNLTHPSQYYRTIENTIGRSEDFGRALQYYSNKGGFAKNNSEDVAKILAADQARHNSTNFFRHGSYGKGINLAIPYWNAGVQGARIQTRRISERPVQTLAKMGFVIAAPSAMIAMNNYGNEKNRQVIEQIPDYEKEGNIVIVGPDAKLNQETGRWEGVFKIPVPPQHIGLHKTIQDAVRAGVTGQPMDIVKDLGRITEDYTTINPTDAKALANRTIPQGLKLIAEPMTNTNFFTGNKIVPDSQKNLPAADQYNDYTSGTAKVAGKLTNTSPRQIDNAIRTGLGGAGQNAVNILDTGLAAAGVIDKKDIKGKTLTDSVTQRFSGAASINPSDSADKKFNEYKKQITDSQAYKNASQYDKSRMLNRLQGDITDVSWFASGKSDKDAKLTKKQKSLMEDGFKADNYTNLDTSSSSLEINKSIPKESSKVLSTYDSFDSKKKDEWLSSRNDNFYRLEKAKYENDKANGKISEIEDIKRSKEVARAEAGSKVSKDTRDLYSLNKTQIYDFVTKNKNGQKLADELMAYDQALLNAGLISKLKFKTGLAPSKKGGKKGGGKKSSVAGGKSILEAAKYANSIRPPKTTGNSTASRGTQLPQLKKASLRKYAVKKEAKPSSKIRTS